MSEEDDDSVRRWREWTQISEPVAVQSSPTPVLGGPLAPSGISARTMALFGIALFVGLAVVITSAGWHPGGSSSVNGAFGPNPAQTSGKVIDGNHATSRNLIQNHFDFLLAQNAPPQIGVGDESGVQIDSDVSHLVDGDPQTAWRVKGDGTHQTITVRFAAGSSIGAPIDRTVTGVGLINGFAKGGHYANGRRILDVDWTVGGKSFRQTFRDDTVTPQVINISPIVTSRVELTIEEVGKARTDYDNYTSISELLIMGY